MTSFTFKILQQRNFPKHQPLDVTKWAEWSMWPLFPWGQWTFSRLLTKAGSLQGDIIEAGVGLGGTSLFLASWARHKGKKVYSLDTFSGLPRFPKLNEVPYFKEKDFSASEQMGDLLFRFNRLIAQHDLIETIVPIKGVFPKSFEKLKVSSKFCFAHIDADLYSSTLAALEWIYPRTVKGGVLALDDFFHPSQGVARAISDYFHSKGIVPVLNVIFPSAVYLIKDETPHEHLVGHDGFNYSFANMRSDRFFRRCLIELKQKTRNKRERNNIELFLHFLSRKKDSPQDIYEYTYLMSPLFVEHIANHQTRDPITI